VLRETNVDNLRGSQDFLPRETGVLGVMTPENTIGRERGNLVLLQSGSTDTPIVFVHPLHGKVDCYQPFVSAFGTDQTFYGLEARGFLEDETPATSVEEMARDYVRLVTDVQPNGPYLIVGYSLGALIALEMAHLLKADDREVPFIASIEHNFRGFEFLFDSEQLRRQQFMGRLEFVFLALVLQNNLTLPYFLRYQTLASAEEQIDSLADECIAVKRFPSSCEKASVLRAIRVYRADFDAAISYEVSPGAVRVAHFLASECFPGFGARGTRDYLQLLRPSNHIKVIKGANHLNILQPPYVKQLVREFKNYLGTYLSRSGPATG
jgi:thioesterase domain-containing protein